MNRVFIWAPWAFLVVTWEPLADVATIPPVDSSIGHSSIHMRRCSGDLDWEVWRYDGQLSASQPIKQESIFFGTNINICSALTIAILEDAAESSLLSHGTVFSVDDLDFQLFKVILPNSQTAECGLRHQSYFSSSVGHGS